MSFEANDLRTSCAQIVRFSSHQFHCDRFLFYKPISLYLQWLIENKCVHTNNGGLVMNKKDVKRKFKVYNALRMALGRSKISQPGKVATLLLEIFLEQNGFLKAAMVVERGLCKKGEFGVWRDYLQKKGFIFFQYDGPGTSHRPGAKLNEYLNKEKLASCEIVVKSDLTQFPKKNEVPSMKEFQALQKDVFELKDVVRKMIEEFEPPYTEEKLEARLSMVNSPAKSVH